MFSYSENCFIEIIKSILTRQFGYIWTFVFTKFTHEDDIWSATTVSIQVQVVQSGRHQTQMFLSENGMVVRTQPGEGSSIPNIRRWSPEIFDPERVDRIIDLSTD